MITNYSFVQSEFLEYQIGDLKKKLTNGWSCVDVEDLCMHMEDSCAYVKKDSSRIWI